MRVVSSRWCVAAFAVVALQAPASAQLFERTPELAPMPARIVSETKFRTTQIPSPTTRPASAVAGLVRKTYALSELSDDPALGAWVAENIPQIVQPGTWNVGDAQHKPVLSYFAPSKILLVYHTPAAHAEVEEFLHSVKKSATAKATHKPTPMFGIAPAQFTAVDAMPAAVTVPAPHTPGYPVPAQTRQPRHLFHFIIRYEGEGVIDSNVVDLIKLQGGGDSGQSGSRPVQGSCPVQQSCPMPASCPVPASTGGTCPAASSKPACSPGALPPATNSSSISISNAVLSSAIGTAAISNAFPVQLVPIAESLTPQR